MIDLDNFKAVNDTFGHPVGDKVIRAVADKLKSSLRGGDILCRYGGEEFLVVLPNVAESPGRQIMERVREICASVSIPDVGRAVTVSIGLAVCRESEDLEELIPRADEALYRAKGGGRNRVELFREERASE
jgi:diguanylate cyclase (GGDEF)-like protein